MSNNIVRRPSQLDNGSVADFYLLLRQSYFGNGMKTKVPFTSPLIGLEILNSPVLREYDEGEHRLVLSYPKNGITQGAMISPDAVLVGYDGDFYSKETDVRGNKYEVRVVRFEGFFSSDYFVSIRDHRGVVVASVNENWELTTGDIDLVEAALASVCRIETKPFDVYVNPLHPGTRRTGKMLICK